jgi:hypothetical protein
VTGNKDIPGLKTHRQVTGITSLTANLTNTQLGALEKILGKKIHDPAYVFQLNCNT